MLVANLPVAKQLEAGKLTNSLESYNKKVFIFKYKYYKYIQVS